MEQTAGRIDGEKVTTPEGMTIRSPYDGQVLGEVPRCTSEHVDRAVAAAKRALARDPLPAWRRAEILDRAAELLAQEDVAEDFARSIATEAAKPIGTARIEVERLASSSASRWPRSASWR